MLAAASNAIVIGFNVRPESKGAALAAKEGVEVRLYTIIYEAVADVRAAMEGLLEPTFREQTHARVEIRQIFNIAGIGTIAGCYVTEGKVPRQSWCDLLRDQVVVHEGKLASLKRFKDDVREVAAGYECGLSLEVLPRHQTRRRDRGLRAYSGHSAHYSGSDRARRAARERRLMSGLNLLRIPTLISWWWEFLKVKLMHSRKPFTQGQAGRSEAHPSAGRQSVQHLDHGVR